MRYAPQSLMSLGTEHICLAPGARYFLPVSVAYENIGILSEDLLDNMRSQVYCDRQVNIDAVHLVKLPRTQVHVGYEFTSTCDRFAIREQIPPWLDSEPELSIVDTLPTEEISAETVIVARYGVWTWGHWIGELLPKIALVEAAFPGRFLFAVPNTYDVSEWRTLRESIEAYGVSRKRLVLLRHDVNCRFKRPWAVTPIWSDHLMHPAAAEQMRAGVRSGPIAKYGNKVAFKRPATDGRTLDNWPDISAHLRSSGFEVVELAKLSFSEQIKIFRGAEVVFSTLGSALTGLIYSPVGVRVASVAPPAFGDRFFYALATDRRGIWSDIRGPINVVDPVDIDRSSFTIEIEHLKSGLAALQHEAIERHQI